MAPDREEKVAGSPASRPGCVITLSVRRAGPDLVVCLTGGEAPHAGSVTVAEPSAGGGEPKVSSIVRAGHLDHLVGEPAARAFAGGLGRTTVCIAGIHYENPDRTLLDQTAALCTGLAAEMVRRLSGEVEKP